ncbi:MAG: hypothetical protein WCI73_01375 [Phycisphaerae bacterium]
MVHDVGWRESDFERFFKAKPELYGKRVVVIRCQKAIHRVVDLVALDEDGTLIIIEIKNEKTTRTAIGQAMEYLSQYQSDEVSLEDIADEFQDHTGKTLREEFLKVFGKELTQISRKRRVILVAPDFDVPSSVCVDFLARQWPDEAVSFEMAKAERNVDGFSLTPFRAPPLQFAKNLQGRFAMTTGGRIVYVLRGGLPAIIWTLGKRRKEDVLFVPTGKAVTARCLRFSKRRLIPLETKPPEAELAPPASTWIEIKTEDTAKLIGYLNGVMRKHRKEDCVMLARFRGGRFRYFQVKARSSFLEKWRAAKVDLPDWPEIVEASRANT